MAELPNLRVRYSPSLFAKLVARRGFPPEGAGPWFLVEVEAPDTVHASGKSRKVVAEALAAINEAKDKPND